MTTKKSAKKKSAQQDPEQLSLEDASLESEISGEDRGDAPAETLDENLAQQAGIEIVDEGTDSEIIEAEATLLEDEHVEEGPPPTIEELQAELSELQAESERLQSESQEYLDGWQRARAEFANLKKRVERETGEMRDRITSEIISRYLDVLDDFDRALTDRPEQEIDESWVDGIAIIHQKLKLILDAEGVEAIPAEGMKFDPNLHEAISYEESEDHDDGQVIEVVKKGYRLGDRVIRPALVRVAK